MCQSYISFMVETLKLLQEDNHNVSYLELRDIHKSYYLGKEEFPVLKGIDLDFNLGEFVSILGESGGGKSTLMNIIGGLDREFQGSVTVAGKRLDHKNEKAMDTYRRDTIGYIYQAYNLISHLSVLDNVLIPLDMTTLNHAEREKRALSLLKRVGLKGDQAKSTPINFLAVSATGGHCTGTGQ